MPLLQAEASKLSNNDLVRGIVEVIVDVDETFGILPFVRTDGKAYVYNRENTLATAQFILPNLNVPESATSFTEVSATLRILIGDVDVDNFLNSTMSDTNDQKAVQIAHKAKAIARLFQNAFINGDTTKQVDLSALGGSSTATNVEFDGLIRLTPAGQQVSLGANGAAWGFDTLDTLLDRMKLGTDALVMSRRTIRDYKKLCRALSSVSPEYVMLSNGRQVLAYSGVPILLNDFIAENVTVGTSNDTTYIFAARMNEVDGLHGIYGGDNLGFSVIEIGQLEGRDATRSRVRWYCALALKSTLSLARVNGVRPV